ncbi:MULTISPECIES: phasin family protein [unclassified Caballeronia]|uniref:phasin family protein n=1 Tax=unclassified Caballeronia TaxID=2646786 RepID=UPI002859251E|nr:MULTISPECIES: phasin family protein [unclassified Caballeronia]MDR5775334.1 phasin family protein [Caballeronia sp. LZ002]MDR5850772.1 phasin family protein [Caballeronia sp. LZ003]
MSSLAPENLIASQKAGFDASFGLATRAVEGFEKLIDLNTRTFKTALDEHQNFVARVFSVRDPKEFFALQSQQSQASAQRVAAYWQSFHEIAAGVRGVYVEAAQGQLEKSQRNAQALVSTLASSAPAGSEAVVNAWKSAIDAATESANSAYEAARKSARQVVEAAETDASVATQGAVRVVSSKGTSVKKA